MKNICIFCGSNMGRDQQYKALAREVGTFLAKNEYTLVFGGGNVGLMGEVADAVIDNGGEAIGVIPAFLTQKERGHSGITRLIETDSMHSRKQKMAEISDAFIAMPGGMGTMDELCEIVTWAQLGLHQKPIGLLNASGYFNLLIQFFDHMESEHFVSNNNRKLLMNNPSIEGLMEAFQNYTPPDADAWLDLHKS